MSKTDRDVDRFNRWAPNYDQHFLQRIVFAPVQKTVLELAAAEVPRPAAILDVGSGTGRLLQAAEQLFPGATLQGVDAAGEMVKQAEVSLPAGSKIQFRLATAEQLPFPDAQFDLVFSTMTFHHWADQSRGISEIARVLAPQGGCSPTSSRPVRCDCSSCSPARGAFTSESRSTRCWRRLECMWWH